MRHARGRRCAMPTLYPRRTTDDVDSMDSFFSPYPTPFLSPPRAEGKIALNITASDVEQLAIPQKLWRVIEETTGWFNIR